MTVYHRTSPMIAVCLILALPAGAFADPPPCPAFPRVACWGALDHATVTRRVDAAHQGDWEAYLKKWEGQLETLRDAQARRKEVFISGMGVRLRGKALSAYLRQVERRQEVTRCLARRRRPESEHWRGSVLSAP